MAELNTVEGVECHDLIVVGAGPAGLSAAINAESERIDTLVLESNNRLGGQAGTSTRIENYPGFPEGVSGEELTARMIDQALKFETEFLAPVRADSLEPTEGGIVVCSDEGEKFMGRSVLITCGVEYRRLRARNLAAYLGRGASYGSPDISTPYRHKKIVVVGGANSAGQAALHLAKACEVHLAVRGSSLDDKMSAYLTDRIADNDNIQVHTGCEVVGVDGDGRLKQVTIKNGDTLTDMAVDEMFILIGSVPKTHWLPDAVARDRGGFVIAGGDLTHESRDQFSEKTEGRQPFAHETLIPGLFAAGDGRFGTIKRVASAVGDGAVVIPELHRYLSLQGRSCLI
ncbi:MAG TPA: FAD-dependent oxidoreductase [Candidatus Saccharimonadales bacterium]|jgi:thioredoxin reductase (NADPH)|nr:FAD-dependent oxidoreductase [Candidatus Saccharimonadales bacterium]